MITNNYAKHLPSSKFDDVHSIFSPMAFSVSSAKIRVSILRDACGVRGGAPAAEGDFLEAIPVIILIYDAFLMTEGWVHV